MNLLRRRGKREVKAIKSKEGDTGSRISKEQEEIQKKLLQNNMQEVELIQKFNTGEMTPVDLQKKLYPLEQERIGNAIKFSEIKVEKKED